MLPHPYIGLATVTYLFEGERLHRDSLGTVQPVWPGEVNWMTLGRGIADYVQKLRGHSTTKPVIRTVSTCWRRLTTLKRNSVSASSPCLEVAMA